MSCGHRHSLSERTAEATRWTDREYDLFQESKFDSALFCLRMADSIAADNDTVRAYTAAERSVIYGTMGKMRESVPYALESIRLSLGIDDYETALNMYNTLGVVYRRMNMPDSALYYYKKGLSLCQEVDSKDYVAHLMACIAVIYSQKDRVKEAMSYIDQAERYARMATDTIEGKMELYQALGVKGGLLIRQNKFQETKAEIEPYIDEIIQTDRASYILPCAAPLISAYVKLGLTNQAEAMIERLRPIISAVGSTSAGAIGILETEAKLYHQRQEYEKELQTWQQIEQIAEKNQGTEPQELLYNKAECYHRLGDEASALKTMRQAYQLSDSLKNSDIDEQMSEFSVRYKTQEKELELVRIRQEKAEQQLQLLSAIALLAIGCAALAIVIMRIQHRRKLAHQTYKIEMGRRFIEGMEDERARLARELHDGTCNDLLGLSILMQQNDRRSIEMVRQIRSNVRRISHELMPPRFTEVDVDTVLRNYVERFPLDACDIKYTSTQDHPWDTVAGSVAYEFYRIVQESLGNIVKHSQPTRINVSLNLTGNCLSMSIVNDGVGSDSATDATDPGIGRQTITDRMNSIGGTIKVEKTDGEYRLTVSAPANHSGKQQL